MLSCLTRTGRLKAGWCLALAYLFCVLAPGLSFAFAAEARAAPCIVENHGPAMEMGVAVRHVHEAGIVHDHSHPASAADDEAKIDNDTGSPVKDSHKGTDNRCCNLVFASAIPAPEIIVAAPVVPNSRCVTDRCKTLTDSAPPVRYRPPIFLT